MKIFGWVVVGCLSLAGLFVVNQVFFVAGTAVQSAKGVVSRTLDADNVIHNYEWFHDTYQGFKRRQAQVVQFKGILADPEITGPEKSRVRMELAAQQQSCRTLATKYNANATKTNRSIFMGREAPPEIDMTLCE